MAPGAAGEVPSGWGRAAVFTYLCCRAPSWSPHGFLRNEDVLAAKKMESVWVSMLAGAESPRGAPWREWLPVWAPQHHTELAGPQGARELPRGCREMREPEDQWAAHPGLRALWVS